MNKQIPLSFHTGRHVSIGSISDLASTETVIWVASAFREENNHGLCGTLASMRR
jgi:hypothetical protein